MTIKTFDSIEDLFDEQDKNRSVADSHVKVAQRAIQVGDCFMRYYPSADIMIYGEVIDPLAFFEGKDLDADDGELRQEMEWEKASRAEPHMKNYRFCRAYSVVCPDGELGDTHVSVMMPISREVFELAKKNEWPKEPIEFGDTLNALILDSLNGTGFWEAHGGRA